MMKTFKINWLERVIKMQIIFQMRQH